MEARQNPTDRHQLQQIVAGLTEGVILVDERQDIVWANEAALTMHGVTVLPELGLTVDQYRARFSLQYRNNHKLSKGDYPIERIIAGEAFRDVVVEVTPPGSDKPRWVHRVRSLVLTRPTGEADCLVLILTDVSDHIEAEERFESSFNVNPAPAIICRLSDMLYIKVNRGFLHLAELRRDQVIGRHFSEIDLFADADKREDALSLVAEGRPVPQWEASLPVSDGHRAVILAGQPIEIDDEPCLMFTFMDLEPRRVAEKALHDTREQSRADVEALYIETPVPLHALDREGRIAIVSDRWLELLGYERDDVIGRPLTDVLTPASQTLFRDKNWPALLANGHVSDLEYQFVRKGGAVADMLVSARTSFDRNGVFNRTTAVLTDITEKKQSEDRFAKTFNVAPVPMLLSTLDRFQVIDANQAFLAMAGRAAADVVGERIDRLDMWEARASWEQLQHALHRETSIRNLDVRLLAADGHVFDCLLSAEIVSLLGQKCALMVFQDITDRRRSETQLFEAIETVMRDTSWFSRSVIEKLAQLRQPSEPARSDALLDTLSRREREILSHLSCGRKDEEISQTLKLSRSTIRNHVAAIYGKIGVHSRSSAIVWAREHGVTGSEMASKRR